MVGITLGHRHFATFKTNPPDYLVPPNEQLHLDQALLQVVIQYDGVEFHFTDSGKVHIGNYEQYMTTSDVERRKVLESYGY